MDGILYKVFKAVLYLCPLYLHWYLQSVMSISNNKHLPISMVAQWVGLCLTAPDSPVWSWARVTVCVETLCMFSPCPPGFLISFHFLKTYQNYTTFIICISYLYKVFESVYYIFSNIMFCLLQHWCFFYMKKSAWKEMNGCSLSFISLVI